MGEARKKATRESDGTRFMFTPISKHIRRPTVAGSLYRRCASLGPAPSGARLVARPRPHHDLHAMRTAPHRELPLLRRETIRERPGGTEGRAPHYSVKVRVQYYAIVRGNGRDRSGGSHRPCPRVESRRLLDRAAVSSTPWRLHWSQNLLGSASAGPRSMVMVRADRRRQAQRRAERFIGQLISRSPVR